MNGPPDRPAKTERLACLYLTFLGSANGLSFREIKRFFGSAYEGDEESARRKFERDKKDLSRLGLELKHFEPGSTLPGGKEATEHIYFPVRRPERRKPPEFTPAERRALLTALGRARKVATPDEQAMIRSIARKWFLESGLFKGDREEWDEDLFLMPGEVQGAVGSAQKAMAEQKYLRFVYEGAPSVRQVAVRALVFHRGRWLLTGYCEASAGMRHFYLDRMSEPEVSATRHRRTFEGPLRVDLHPLSLEIHEPVRIRFRIQSSAEDTLYDFLDDYPLKESNGLFELETPNRPAFFRWMLRNPEAVSGLDQDSREAYKELIARMQSLYRGVA
ncbi:MAG: WYL domain-containing protein [Spirochaetales bacterium]|nr:WYL domain-containing protein [Spirochaetales bacterium]